MIGDQYMYYPALHYPSPKIGKEIWRYKDFYVTEFQGRYELIKDGYSVARLVNGKETLKKYYKNNFQTWINYIRKRDLAKAKKIEAHAKKALEDKDFLLRFWK